MIITDHRLFRQNCLIGGEWQAANDGATLAVRNPADGTTVGTVPRLGRTETGRAIAAAEQVFPAWRARTAAERADLLRRWHALMLDHQDELAQIMTTEQGKPLAESRGEIAFAASFLLWFAEEARRVYGDIIPSPWPHRQLVVTKQPVGVVAAITPWNFPAAMIARKVGPALAVGCTTVIKPASQTPFTALAMAALAEMAGFPPGTINVVTGSARDIGAELTENPAVRKLTFTGSTEIGKVLMAQCAGTVKKLTMELGGNAPFIVFDDADLEAAVAGAMLSKYRNTGQTCVCANRFLVQDGIYDAFAERLAEAARDLKVGDGMGDGVQQGPLIDQGAVEKVEAHVADAVAKGARLAAGGRRHALGGTFYEPTVLVDVTTDMAVATEETFGPVAPLFRFRTEDEAVAMANATEFGLAAYFYTRDLGRAWRVSDALEYGLIGINEGFISTEVAPFGGMKESGLGREGSRYGIDDYLEVKYTCMGGLGG